MRSTTRSLVAVVSPYMAFGTTDDELAAIADKMTAALAASPPAYVDVGTALLLLARADRDVVVQKMLARGARPADITVALSSAPVATTSSPPVPAWAVALHTAGAAAGAYHGYKRNESVGWALVWALAGGMFPIIVPVIAVAQGFGKRKGR